MCQLSCVQKTCLVMIIVALPDPYLGQKQNSACTGHKTVAMYPLQASRPFLLSTTIHFLLLFSGTTGKAKKTKSRPLTKAISIRNSAATHHYLQWHGMLFANQEACLTPTLETLMSQTVLLKLSIYYDTRTRLKSERYYYHGAVQIFQERTCTAHSTDVW